MHLPAIPSPVKHKLSVIYNSRGAAGLLIIATAYQAGAAIVHATQGDYMSAADAARMSTAGSYLSLNHEIVAPSEVAQKLLPAFNNAVCQIGFWTAAFGVSALQATAGDDVHMAGIRATVAAAMIARTSAKAVKALKNRHT